MRTHYTNRKTQEQATAAVIGRIRSKQYYAAVLVPKLNSTPTTMNFVRIVALFLQVVTNSTWSINPTSSTSCITTGKHTWYQLQYISNCTNPQRCALTQFCSTHQAAIQYNCVRQPHLNHIFSTTYIKLNIIASYRCRQIGSKLNGQTG